MTQTIYGKTEGLKKQVLTQLEGIYELRADEGQLISQELALVLRDLSDAINREISLYIDRKGRVTAVSVAATAMWNCPGRIPAGARTGCAGWPASIPILPGRRLSGVDLSALRDLRFDAMAAMAGKHPRANLFSASDDHDLDEDQQPVLQEFGPFKVKDVAAMPFGTWSTLWKRSWPNGPGTTIWRKGRNGPC